eukprot:gnl/Carplike_NY0171/7788_a10779_277.p1 GENE.gnl/Carplike_NY0171/7788_a10779_277~~gnl/Carplike_NY0171/7788_a10779_277.p1  ORF type:complete len:126 (+),score=17.29 gnl/Carplike_NY0171/7788_a10779_277:2-379(+)
MLLFLHNITRCRAKDCTNEHPLDIRIEKVKLKEREFKLELMKNLWDRIDYKALKELIVVLKLESEDHPLPDDIPEDVSEEFLKNLHFYLFQIDIEKGVLCCQTCKKEYPIKHGIPNMIIGSDECK